MKDKLIGRMNKFLASDNLQQNISEQQELVQGRSTFRSTSRMSNSSPRPTNGNKTAMSSRSTKYQQTVCRVILNQPLPDNSLKLPQTCVTQPSIDLDAENIFKIKKMSTIKRMRKTENQFHL